MKKKGVHYSIISLLLSLGFLVGIIGAWAFNMCTAKSSLWIGLLLFLAAFIPKSITRVAFSLLSGILLGANCVAPYLAARDTVSTLIGSTVVLAGTVAASPKSKNGSLRIILKNPSVNYSTSALKCQIYLSLIDSDINIEAGDVIEIKGKLNDGFGSYAVSVYRANLLRISKPDPPNYFAWARNKISSRIKVSVPEQSSGLALAYLLGDTDELSEELQANIKRAGISHMVAVSGFHLGIIVGTVGKVFKKISRFASLWASVIIMVIFVLIVGLGASLTRACLAMVINSIARYYGRSMQKLRLIIFVAGLSLLLSPLQFLELGWQYSFLAYIGIVIVAPIFESFLYGNKRSGVIIGALLQSFSAQLLCLPIGLYNFGSFSVVGLITGVILSPTMAPLMLLIVASIASQSFGILAAMLLKLHVVIIQKTASFSWASISLVANASIFLLYIPIALIVAIMYGNNRVHSLAKSEKYGKIYSC